MISLIAPPYCRRWYREFLTMILNHHDRILPNQDCVQFAFTHSGIVKRSPQKKARLPVLALVLVQVSGVQ